MNRSLLAAHQNLAAHQKQSGITFIGLMILGALLAFWVLIIVKLVPVYLEAYGLKKVFKDYHLEYEKVGEEKKQIIDFFERGMQVNNVRGVHPKELKIEKNKEKMKVTLDYEVRLPMFANVDVLLSFKNHAEVERKYKRQ